jgi:uncharacterized protein (TIGR01777 family)
MRVIITGGSGLIGRELTATLSYGGHDVILLSRWPNRVQDLPLKAKAVEWDGRTPQGWGDLVNSADAIVNLAGANIAGGRWTDQGKQILRDSRVEAGQAVVEAVRAAVNKPRVVVQASAVGYYGARGMEEVTETTPAGSGFLPELCKDWEASTAPVEQLGVRRAIARTGVVLSPDSGALPRMMTPFRFFVGGPLGSGKQWFPWIHFTDEVNALKYLIESESASGAYNLCSPTPVTNAEFSRILGKRMHRPCWLPVPDFALRLLFGEMADVLLKGQKQVPRRLQRSSFRFLYTAADAALKDILY